MIAIFTELKVPVKVTTKTMQLNINYCKTVAAYECSRRDSGV